MGKTNFEMNVQFHKCMHFFRRSYGFERASLYIIHFELLLTCIKNSWAAIIEYSKNFCRIFLLFVFNSYIFISAIIYQRIFCMKLQVPLKIPFMLFWLNIEILDVIQYSCVHHSHCTTSWMHSLIFF